MSAHVCEKEKLIPRQGAKDGDLIFSSGLFGLTTLGYKKLLHNEQIPVELIDLVLSATLEPKAKINYLDLFKEISINTCMDSSDGLLITLKELSEINKMGIDVKGMGIPLSNYLKEGWQTLSL